MLGNLRKPNACSIGDFFNARRNAIKHINGIKNIRRPNLIAPTYDGIELVAKPDCALPVIHLGRFMVVVPSESIGIAFWKKGQDARQRMTDAFYYPPARTIAIIRFLTIVDKPRVIAKPFDRTLHSKRLEIASNVATVVPSENPNAFPFYIAQSLFPSFIMHITRRNYRAIHASGFPKVHAKRNRRRFPVQVCPS